jgi:hypothetical protein
MKRKIKMLRKIIKRMIKIIRIEIKMIKNQNINKKMKRWIKIIINKINKRKRNTHYILRV